MEEQGTDGQPAGVPPASENAAKFLSAFEFSLPADFATTRPGMGHEELESEALRLFPDKFTSWGNEGRVGGQTPPTQIPTAGGATRETWEPSKMNFRKADGEFRVTAFNTYRTLSERLPAIFIDRAYRTYGVVSSPAPCLPLTPHATNPNHASRYQYSKKGLGTVR